MGRILVEAWLGRVGLLRRHRPDGKGVPAADAVAAPAAVGVLALEVAGLISRIAHLWHSLADDQVARLRDEVVRLEGVRKLVSDDRGFLLALALSEMLESLGSAARAAAVLGRRCSVPALRHLEHVLPEVVAAAVAAGGEGMTSECALGGLQGWAFTEKKMERKVRKMERLAAATVQLYQEMEVLAEMEQSLRRAQQATTGGSGFFQFQLQGASLMDLRQKVTWQRQEVKALREQSLWGRSYNYVVRLLARSLFTIVLRINLVFGLHRTVSTSTVGRGDGDARSSSGFLPRSRSVAAGSTHSSFHLANGDAARLFCSGPLERGSTRTTKSAGRVACGTTSVGGGGGQRPPQGGLPPLPGGGKHHSLSSKARWSVSGGPFRGCMVGGSESPVLRSCVPDNGGGGGGGGGGRRRPKPEDSDTASSLLSNNSPKSGGGGGDMLGGVDDVDMAPLLDAKRKLLCAPPSTTLGASALALHYANMIIVIEKLAVSPHLIGPDARDDLYTMLPTSVRAALRTRLKPYAKNLASCVYDPVLAADWHDAVARILEWLAPLAHNMIRWQSERNYEQQHRVSTSNVLLLQTLYFANQAKTEAAIVELLVGLNYLWRFAREMNDKAILECVSNREFQDCLDAKI